MVCFGFARYDVRMDYRHDRTAGATYFFTVVTYDRRPVLCRADILALLREAVAAERRRRSFAIDAMVVLPDHLHALWTLPEDDHDYSVRWQKIKESVSRAAPIGGAGTPAWRRARGERTFWQRRFWEHRIRDEHDHARHFDYIHFNPVKHRLVAAVADWPHSSFHRAVRQGVYPASWGAGFTPADLPSEP